MQIQTVRGELREAQGFILELKNDFDILSQTGEISDKSLSESITTEIKIEQEKIEKLKDKIRTLEESKSSLMELKFSIYGKQEILETLKHYVPLTEIPASNILYRQRGFVHKESYKRTHKRGLQLRSKLGRWPYLCAQYTGWHIYGLTGGKESGAQYRKAWRFYHYITGKKDSAFEGVKFNRSNVKQVLEADSTPKFLGLYYSVTGTGKDVAKSKRKYRNIQRKLAKHRSGEVTLSPRRLAILEEAERTDKVTNNSHMALVLPKRSFTKKILVDSGFITVGAFLNNYYGLDQHTKQKEKNVIQDFSVSLGILKKSLEITLMPILY